MSSKADNRKAAFTALGGAYLNPKLSLADLSMLHLTNKGYTTGSLADRQRAAGMLVDKRGTIDPTLYP